MTFVKTGCLQIEKRGGRVMAPTVLPRTEGCLWFAGSVVQEGGTVHSFSGRFKTDMHTGGMRDIGIRHLAQEPSCTRKIGMGRS